MKNIQLPETQAERMAAAVGSHIGWQNNSGRVDSVTVYPGHSDEPDKGWMEWLLVYEYVGGGKLTVGAILRTPDQLDVEFHS